LLSTILTFLDSTALVFVFLRLLFGGDLGVSSEVVVDVVLRWSVDE
jgi:hypothetical protein